MAPAFSRCVITTQVIYAEYLPPCSPPRSFHSERECDQHPLVWSHKSGIVVHCGYPTDEPDRYLTGNQSRGDHNLLV